MIDKAIAGRVGLETKNAYEVSVAASAGGAKSKLEDAYGI
jgi:hypothetical protein